MRRGTGPDARTTEDSVAERRCLVSGQLQPRAGLIRFVLSPEGIVTADIEESLPGRGFWLAAERDVLEQAAKRSPFARASKGQAKPLPPDWLSLLENRLRQRCKDLLGLARRSGLVSCGFDKAQETLRKSVRAKTAVVWLEATEASPGESRRLARGAGISDEPCSVLTSEDMASALGLEHAVHVVLTAHRLTENLRKDLTRLQGVLGVTPRGASFAGEISATSTPNTTDVT